MKKILVLDFSPRKKGNCAGLTKVMAEEISAKGGEAVCFAARDMDVKPCKGCNGCKKKDTAFCVQKDDFTAMLPLLDECDGIAFAAPVYVGHVPGPAKTFIDRLYCFFNPARKEPLFTVKDPKKMAVLLPCGGGDPAAYRSIGDWVGHGFGMIGVTEHRVAVRNGLNDLWDPEEESRKAYAAEAKELADWLME